MKAKVKTVTKKTAAKVVGINEDTAAAIIGMLDRKVEYIKKSGREIWLLSGILFSKNEIRKCIQ